MAISGPFTFPVDLSIYPDYNDVIAEPVCLETIAERTLVAGHYASAGAYLKDMRLLYDNCRRCVRTCVRVCAGDSVRVA